MKKTICLILLCALVAGTAGCGRFALRPAGTAKGNLSIDFTQYKESEDIPDWGGAELSLTKWEQAANPNSGTNKTVIVKDDPITKEIKRITGITYDADESFDNGGGSYDAVVAKIIASGHFPHIAEGVPDPSNFIKEGYLWELSEYIEKYAPIYYKTFGPSSKTLYGDLWKLQMEQYGGIYELAVGSEKSLYDMRDKDGTLDMTDEEIAAVAGMGNPAYPFVYIRDDVLKMLYPQSHTVAELKEIFKNKGSFTKEEIFDVPIESPDDFVKMLYRIRDMKLNDGNGETYPIYTHTGADNWPVLVHLGAMFQYSVSPFEANVNYFSYYDMNDDTIKPTFKQQWFKNILKLHNKLIRDGVAPQEALIDTNNIFKEKLNNGRYIVTYGQNCPTEAELNGKYAYRKVFAKYKTNDKDFLFNAWDYTSWNRLTFFKESLSKEQLIQTLRMIDFMLSDAGQKLVNWGPKSLGLFTEDENGRRLFKDEKIKNEILYSAEYGKDTITPLGLTPTWPTRIEFKSGKYSPSASYVNEIKTWERAFNAVHIERFKYIPSKVPSIFDPTVLAKMQNFKRFWDVRNGYEDSLLKIFAAESDEQFEVLYNNMVNYAEKNGLTDETYKEYTEFYKNDYNKAYMHYIEEAKSN